MLTGAAGTMKLDRQSMIYLGLAIVGIAAAVLITFMR